MGAQHKNSFVSNRLKILTQALDNALRFFRTMAVDPDYQQIFIYLLFKRRFQLGAAKVGARSSQTVKFVHAGIDAINSFALNDEVS